MPFTSLFRSAARSGKAAPPERRFPADCRKESGSRIGAGPFLIVHINRRGRILPHLNHGKRHRNPFSESSCTSFFTSSFIVWEIAFPSMICAIFSPFSAAGRRPCDLLFCLQKMRCSSRAPPPQDSNGAARHCPGLRGPPRTAVPGLRAAPRTAASGLRTAP